MGSDHNIGGNDMKINIGPYKSDIIPVGSWERRYEFWRRPETCYLPEEEYTKFDKFVFAFFDKLDDLVRPLNRWSNSRKRRVKVHIDYYDVWSADHTLAMIIHPVLVKLKEVKHGYPHVDSEDVPEELRLTPADQEKLEYDGTVDAKHEARWEWILDEMIWTFSQHGLEDDSDQYYHNTDQLEMLFVSTGDENLDSKGMKALEFNHQKDPNKPAYWRDDEGLKKHAERKANGRRLFAKYYESLWD
jgi:hypothetical protein